MIPQLYNSDAWDASNEKTFRFLFEGNQAFGNILQIKNNLTGEVVYQESETTMQLKHTVPANTLKNGTLYNVRVAVIDIDNNVSEYSDPMLFYCYTTPTFTFDNIQENQIVKNSSYQVYMTYNQIENEPLQSWEITLYDTSQSKIQSSGVFYDDNIKYTLTNLEDNQNYYIKATCITLNGFEVDTGFIPFSVNYKQPSVYSILTLENIKNNGYIKLQSNIRAVEAHSKTDVMYIDGEYADLRNNTVYIDNDFSLDDDFVINLLGYNLTTNALIMQLSDGNNKINLYLRKGTYDINNNKEKTFIELSVPVGFTSYVCYSNYIDNPNKSDMLDIWIRKKNGLYSVYINNNDGE
jgi:hypothetical protein